MLEQYQKRNDQEEKWILKHEFQVLDLSMPLIDLDIYKDGIIALEAVEKADSSRYTMRQPLQPVNTQQTVKPEPNAVGIKSPPATPQTPNDENLFYQSLHGSRPNFPSSQPGMPPQAHPQPFNPSVNTFPRQSPNVIRPSSPYVRAPAQSASPAAAARTGFSVYRSSYPNMPEGRN